jgi:hypothetical protein
MAGRYAHAQAVQAPSSPTALQDFADDRRSPSAAQLSIGFTARMTDTCSGTRDDRLLSVGEVGALTHIPGRPLIFCVGLGAGIVVFGAGVHGESINDRYSPGVHAHQLV